MNRGSPGNPGLVSIAAIIPLFNGERFIEQAIRSVVAQTLHPDEFIVVDDGSTDGSAAIVERLALEFPITLLRKRNGGQSSARNHGVARSTAALIAFLDQDDAWHPTHLADLLGPFLEERPIPLGWSYSNLDEADEQGLIVTRSFLDTQPARHPKKSVADCLRQDMFVLPSASLIAREAFAQVGGFDERLCGYEDDDLFLRIFRSGYDNAFIDKPLSIWRIYPTSTSYTPHMARSRAVYAQKLLNAFPDNPAQNRYLGKDLIVPRFLRSILGQYSRALRQGDRSAWDGAIADLHRLLLPHAGLRHRLIIYALYYLLSYYGLARAVDRIRLLPLAARLVRQTSIFF